MGAWCSTWLSRCQDKLEDPYDAVAVAVKAKTLEDVHLCCTCEDLRISPAWSLPRCFRRECRSFVQRIAAKERCWLLSIREEGIQAASDVCLLLQRSEAPWTPSVTRPKQIGRLGLKAPKLLFESGASFAEAAAEAAVEVFRRHRKPAHCRVLFGIDLGSANRELHEFDLGDSNKSARIPDGVRA